ncbi:hypothetical protein C0991_008031, partial [Blastosporella zonata]
MDKNGDNHNNDNTVNPISHLLRQQGAIDARSPYPVVMPRTPQAPTKRAITKSTAPDEGDGNDWEETVCRLKRQKVPRGGKWKTTAEIRDEERARAERIIKQATANISDESLAASSGEGTPSSQCTPLPSKPIVFIGSTPQQSINPQSIEPSSAALPSPRPPPPATENIDDIMMSSPTPLPSNIDQAVFSEPATQGSSNETSGVASTLPTTSPTITTTSVVTSPAIATTLPQLGTGSNASDVMTSSLTSSTSNQLKCGASAVNSNTDVPTASKKPCYTPEPSSATNKTNVVIVDASPILPPCSLDINIPAIKVEAGGSTSHIPPPAPHHTRPSPAPEPYYPPQSSWYPPPPPPPLHRPSPVPEASNTTNANVDARTDQHNWYPPPPPPPSHQPNAAPNTSNGKADSTSHPH